MALRTSFTGVTGALAGTGLHFSATIQIDYMSTIDIRSLHTLNHDAALNAADELAQDLAQKFAIDYGWDGDVIHFERPGVHGQIEVHDQRIEIRAHLGFLLIMLKPAIEQEIVRYLREHFGCEL